MDKEKLKNYEKPQMEVFLLRAKNQLLSGSTGAENDGYGEAVPEGNDGWH